MKHMYALFLAGCVTNAFVTIANAATPARPDTPIAQDLIDPSVFAEWVDGAEHSLDTSKRESSPEWILWTNDKNGPPGHSGLTFGTSKSPGARH